MLRPDADRRAFHDVEFLTAGVNEVELTQWMLAM
jgi:hypothetical protein